MASILRVNTLTDASSNNSIATSFVAGGSAKSWFVFDQVNSNTLDDSLNIGSITDRGTGCMYGNFTNSMGTVNYAVMASSSPVASGSMATNNNNRSCIASADTASRCSINVFNTDDLGFADEENQQGLVHGDLA